MDNKTKTSKTSSFFAKWRGRNLIKEIRNEQKLLVQDEQKISRLAQLDQDIRTGKAKKLTIKHEE